MEEFKNSARLFRFWYLYFKIETENRKEKIDE